MRKSHQIRTPWISRVVHVTQIHAVVKRFSSAGCDGLAPWTPSRSQPSSRSTTRPPVVPTSSGRRRRTSPAPAAGLPALPGVVLTTGWSQHDTDDAVAAVA